MSDLRADYAAAGFGGRLPFGTRPALLIVDVCNAYLDPASPLCHDFYEALVKHDLPLISHGGEEHAVEGAKRPEFGNVLKLRVPLKLGVRVIVAHCASLGKYPNIDPDGKGAPTESFLLFENMMADSEYRGRLFGDISAITQTNRARTALARVLHLHERAVIATGGSIVSEPETYDLLLGNCFTVWLKAQPEEHMARVVAQGDTRPMKGNREAMDDLRRILLTRAPLYGRADAVVDTSGRVLDASLEELASLAKPPKEINR